jgi:hypothetical protein
VGLFERPPTESDVFEVDFFGSRHPLASPDARGPHVRLCYICARAAPLGGRRGDAVNHVDASAGPTGRDLGLIMPPISGSRAIFWQGTNDRKQIGVIFDVIIKRLLTEVGSPGGPPGLEVPRPVCPIDSAAPVWTLACWGQLLISAKNAHAGIVPEASWLAEASGLGCI